MPEITVGEDFARAGVAVRLGCVTAAITVGDADTGLIAALEEAAATRTAGLDGHAVAEVPEIAATRRAYKALGKDPARYRPSAEALMRRLVQGKGLFHINNVVDVNNLVSLETGYSIGAYDRDRLAPPVVFRSGREGESYAAIGRGPINLAGLPLFADAEGAFGSPTSDSERTMITGQTTHLLMVLIGFEASAEAMQAAVETAVERLRRFCAARHVETAIVAGGA